MGLNAFSDVNASHVYVCVLESLPAFFFSLSPYYFGLSIARVRSAHISFVTALSLPFFLISNTEFYSYECNAIHMYWCLVKNTVQQCCIFLRFFSYIGCVLFVVFRISIFSFCHTVHCLCCAILFSAHYQSYIEQCVAFDFGSVFELTSFSLRHFFRYFKK